MNLRVVLGAVFLIIGLSYCMSINAFAATSQLTQTISPIRCTYTVLTTGTTTATPTQCTSQLAPTLSTFTITLRPYLTGTFSAINTKSLRIWVGEHWFTLGISNALTVNGDNWMLNLADTSIVLAPNTAYTIIVETTTPNSYVLSSVYQDVLVTKSLPPSSTTPTAPSPATLLPLDTSNLVPEYTVIDPAVPLKKKSTTYRNPQIGDSYVLKLSDVGGSLFRSLDYVLIIIGVTLIVVVIYAALRFRKH